MSCSFTSTSSPTTGAFLSNVPWSLLKMLMILGSGVPVFFAISGFLISASLIRHGEVGKIPF